MIVWLLAKLDVILCFVLATNTKLICTTDISRITFFVQQKDIARYSTSRQKPHTKLITAIFGPSVSGLRLLALTYVLRPLDNAGLLFVCSAGGVFMPVAVCDR